MNIKIATVCFLVATVLAPVAAYAADSDSDRAHPMTFVKDSVITTKVKAGLANEKMRSLAHIRVDTDRDGVVFLSGEAETQAAADKAVSIARGTEGVISVKSSIRIKKDD